MSSPVQSGNQQRDLPIFPLPMCVLPGEIIPLRIFEPRYKALIEWCDQSKDDNHFAILMSENGGVSPFGCLVKLISIAGEFENTDGDLLIFVGGLRRVKFLSRLKDRMYPMARLELLSFDSDDAPKKQVATALVQAEDYAEDLKIDLELDLERTTSLSFHLASKLQLDALEKLELLRRDEEEDRLEVLQKIINLNQQFQQSNSNYNSDIKH